MANPMITDVDTCLKDIADWYIEKRRGITEPELESIVMKHCGTEVEVKKFVKFLETEPGQLRFKTLLRERRERIKATGSPEIPLNWYETIRRETRDGQEGWLVYIYSPVGWPNNPRIEKTQGWVAKNIYNDWAERAYPWTYERWRLDIWKEVGKPIERMPRIDPHATVIHQDKQLIEQMKWLKAHGFKTAREAQEAGY